MESETEFEEERVLEVEDFLLSDVEETLEKESDPINIDYNSRITSESHDLKLDNAGNVYENVSNVSKFQLTDRDMFGDTSCEELEMSDDDLPSSDFVNMQKVILDGICCFAGNRNSDAASSYNYSSTNFKEDCVTDAEYVSEDDADANTGAGFYHKLVEKSGRRLSNGLSIAPPGKDEISINGVPLTSVNIANSYSSSILIKRRKSNTVDATDKSHLMTCLEFLKSEFSDDEGTDVEEFSIDEGLAVNPDSSGVSQSNGSMACIINNSVGHERGGADFFDVYKNRKSSLTTEFLIEDESSVGENDVDPMRLNRKRLSNAGVYTDCQTDEEDFDLLDLKEWTETDESGDVRQITQIKTETSIKLEGDGDGSAFDSDDLVSTTATTTTTRVVTSVITNPDEESDIDSTFVQQVSEDGIRQSCEITFSEVLNDRSTSQPGESGCEE